MPASQVLAVNSTVGESATFTLTTDTLVWVHASANGVVVIDAIGSDGKPSEVVTMVANTASKSGVLPAGDYKATRQSGTCGFQRAA